MRYSVKSTINGKDPKCWGTTDTWEDATILLLEQRDVIVSQGVDEDTDEILIDMPDSFLGTIDGKTYSLSIEVF